MNYAEFLERKTQFGCDHGFDPVWMPDMLFPFQRALVEWACVLWSNPGEVVLTPFMGVGSECYGAVLNDRKAIGIDLKPSYYRQAVRNLASIKRDATTGELFAGEALEDRNTKGETEA